MTPEIVSAEQTDDDGLVALFHRLHELSVWLVTEQPATDEVVRAVIGLLDDGAPLVPTLNRVAPGVLDVFAKLDEVHDVAALTGELAEAHRLLGHGLRGHGITPGPPAVPVGDLLRESLTERLVTGRPYIGLTTNRGNR